MTKKSAFSENPVLVVKDLQTRFFTQKGVVRAVNGVNLTLHRGEILAIVGESGSGKSVTGYSLMGLVDPPGKIVAGSIRLNGVELVTLPEKALCAYRGRDIAMVFQDPMMTLDPLMRIAGQMTEAILVHEKVSRRQALTRALAVLDKVGIADPQERLRAYPHELSGGMRQRIAIAIAMLNRPDVLIADEPTTALDVTIQGQILAEMQRLAEEENMAMIWITHDLSVAANLARRIAVMYAGSIVETGLTDEVISRPQHPYTAGLIASLPSRQKAQRGLLKQIPGMVSSLLDLDDGCPFRQRCSYASAKCASAFPVRKTPAGHWVACWHPLKGSSCREAA